ncbi:hypothetical protein Fot_12302 [Forsythia ovata]|uniref:Uncharacterized protein n=1 Tax=Forsythia ovata TaxID=205694 RepID=A0ABD1WMK3_9LAMI
MNKDTSEDMIHAIVDSPRISQQQNSPSSSNQPQITPSSFSQPGNSPSPFVPSAISTQQQDSNPWKHHPFWRLSINSCGVISLRDDVAATYIGLRSGVARVVLDAVRVVTMDFFVQRHKSHIILPIR